MVSWPSPSGAPAETLSLPSLHHSSVLGQPPLSTSPGYCFLTTGNVLAVPASASPSPHTLLSFGVVLPKADPLSDPPDTASSGGQIVLFGAVISRLSSPLPCAWGNQGSESSGHSSCQGQKP